MSSVFTYSKIHETYFHANGERVEYKKDYPLLWSKDRSPWVFFLEQGIIKANVVSNNTFETLLGYFLPGSTFAQSGSFFGLITENVVFEALTPSVLYRVHQEDFLDKLDSDHEFCRDYSQTIAKYNLFLIDRISYQNEKGIRLKALKWLSFMAKYYGEPKDNGYLIYIPMTQETIAKFLHCTRESANKAFSELKNDGLVSTQKRQLLIHDIDAIQELIKNEQ